MDGGISAEHVEVAGIDENSIVIEESDDQIRLGFGNVVRQIIRYFFGDRGEGLVADVQSATQVSAFDPRARIIDVLREIGPEDVVGSAVPVKLIDF